MEECGGWVKQGKIHILIYLYIVRKVASIMIPWPSGSVAEGGGVRES